MLPKGPWWPGLLRGCLGGLRALKKENYRVTYGFTELRGKPAGRGRDGRAPRNQVVAGTLSTHLICIITSRSLARTRTITSQDDHISVISSQANHHVRRGQGGRHRLARAS